MNPSNYQQNYYDNQPDNCGQFYQTEADHFESHYEDPPSLRVPDAQLYADDVEDMTEMFSRNPPFSDSVPPLEMPRRSVNVEQPSEYFYKGVQHHKPHYEPVAKHQAQKMRANNYHYPQCTEYSTSMEDQVVHRRNEKIYVDEGGYYCDQYSHTKASPHVCKVHQNKIQTCTLHQNYGSVKMPPVEPRMKSKKIIKDVYIDYREKNFYGHKVARGTPVRKQAVSVKTPKYFTRNPLSATGSKRASVLCLPVVSQADPALTKRKSRTTHQIRKNSPQTTTLFANAFEQSDTFSTHKMNSQGDVKKHSAPKGVETFLDNYEDNFEQSDDFYDVNVGNVNEREEQEFKQFAKFLKPRVPSSIKIRQEKLANMKAQKSLEPNLKLSLDKLLNRLQKCENAESIEKVSLSCSHEDLQAKNENCKDKRELKIDKVDSFNYETLSRKCSPANEDSEVFNSGKAKPVSKWFGPVEPEKSIKLLRPMDEQCALDLHKSKSYIVDLIDRALSKELGTVPRDQTVFENLTPNKAVATISRQQKFQKHRNGVSYEVTAALTDSIISNASAPPNPDSNQLVERSRSQGEMKEKSGEDAYIKQLKQLRWGHIRHIQHEARRLADLEEFLEKCGEIEY